MLRKLLFLRKSNFSKAFYISNSSGANLSSLPLGIFRGSCFSCPFKEKLTNFKKLGKDTNL